MVSYKVFCDVIRGVYEYLKWVLHIALFFTGTLGIAYYFGGLMARPPANIGVSISYAGCLIIVLWQFLSNTPVINLERIIIVGNEEKSPTNSDNS